MREVDKRNTVFNNRIIVTLLLFPYLKFGLFINFPLLNTVFNWLAILNFVLILICGLLSSGFSIITYMIVLFYGVNILSAVVNKGDVYGELAIAFLSIALCMIFDLGLKTNPKILLNQLLWVLGILMLFNLFLILFYPKGLYSTSEYDTNWILGYKNIQIRTILPTVGLVCVYSYLIYKKIVFQAWLLIFCMVITILLLNSATSVVGMVIFLLLMALFLKPNKIPRFINLNLTVILMALLGYALITLNIQSRFSYLIENILHRNLDFTGRTIIWENTIRYISKYPLLGVGNQTDANMFSMLSGDHPHNYFLYLLFTGGVVGLAIACVIFFMASRQLGRYRDHPVDRIILFVLIAFFFMGLAESLTAAPMLYPMFIMAYDMKYLILVEEEESLPNTKKTDFSINVLRPHSFSDRARYHSRYIK
jgi:O-antigen ligase